MEKNKTSRSTNRSVPTNEAVGGAFGQVIGGGTALIRGKKPTFTALNGKRRSAEDIVTDPLGSWTGVPADDPYEKPIQDADDL